MGTTLLFVELLIAGIQVLVWLLILILSVFGYEWIYSIQSQDLSNWQILVTSILLAFVYVLGILFDRLADLIFSKWDKAISNKMLPYPPHTLAVIRYQIAKANEYLYQQLEYTRSRMRIARASSLNFAITTILTMIFVATRLPWIPNQAQTLFFIAVTGILLTAVAVFTWYNLVRSYFGFIKANYPQEPKQEKAEPTQEPPVSAQQAIPADHAR